MINFQKIKDYWLLLFVFTIPFYNWKVFSFENTSIPFIISVGYFVISIISKLKLRFSTIKYFIPLYLLAIWMFITSMLSARISAEPVIINYSFIMLIIMSILVVSHLSNNAVIKRVLISYVLGNLLIGILMLFGVGTETISNRITIFGDNANNVAIRATLSFIISLYFIYNKRDVKIVRFVAYLSLFLSLYIILTTASRGALISLFAGILLLILFSNIALYRKIAVLFFIIALGSIFYISIVDISNIISRLTELYTSGDETRMDIYQTYLSFVVRNPIIGYGQNGLNQISQSVFYRNVSPHNWFLYVMLVGGAIGLTFFLIFMIRVLRDSISLLKKNNHVLPLALYVVILLHILKSGNQLTDISFWIVMSIIVSLKINSRNYEDSLRY